MVEFDIVNISAKQEMPDITSQKSLIQKWLKEPMVVDQTWYIIDFKWFKTFKYFVGIDNADRCSSAVNPGPIDNSLLLEADGMNLKPGLVEDLDYIPIPPSVWALLYSWYGLKENQESIGRKVIGIGRPPKVEPRLEVYKVELHLYNNSDLEAPYIHQFSAADSMLKVEEVCRKAFNMPDQQQVQLRCFYKANMSQVLAKESTVHDESLDCNQKIVIEAVEPVETAKTFPKPAPKIKEFSKIPRAVPNNNRPVPVSGVMTRHGGAMGYGSSTLGSAEGRGSPGTPGLSGLMNLGNTCFLNSIIQCLSNCGPVTQYFLDGNHKLEINATNPLGKAGQIASSFADVIGMMWSGKHSLTVPHYFKVQLTKFAPQFAGCQQHDAQELLTFLLDGLHEDLNRIKEKPYCQNEENEQEDDALARMAWEYFLRRNDSIIIDHFHGMLKSRVVCPDCEKISTKFDTFSTLSLPLPLRCDRTIKVRHIPYEQSCKVTDLQIVVPKNGVVRDIAEELSKVTQIRVEQMVITEINKSHFHKFFSFDDPIDKIDVREKIYMYDLPEDFTDSKFTTLPVVLWEVPGPSRSAHFLSSLFGTPFLMQLPRGRMYFKNLYDTICLRMTRSCEGFLKANTNVGCFSMDFDTGAEDSNKNNAVENKFTPVLVNTFCYENVKTIKDDEQDVFVVPESFGRYQLALQITQQVRQELYRDPTPIFEDNLENFRPSPRPSLENCLNLFTTTEKLGENNAWHCPSCNKKKRATKKLDLWKLPNILIFHLKRFAFNENRKEKLDIKVEFPLTDLNIDHYVVNKHKENLVYDLIGVCNHYGSLMGGHYTANCKSYKDGQWYCFDDNYVSPVSAESVQTENAYVLFYQRRPITRANPDEEKIDL